MKATSLETFPRVKGLRQDLWRESALLALLFMDLGWMVPWVHLLLSTEKGEISLLRVFLVFGSVLFGGFLLRRSIDRFRLPDPLSRPVFGVYFLACVLAGLKGLFYFQEGIRLTEFFKLFSRLNQPSPETLLLLPVEFIAIPVLLLGALRGISLAKSLMSPSLVVSHFRFGLVFFLIYGIMIAVLPRMVQLTYGITLAASPGFMPAIFILSSLLAVSAARISGLSQLRGGHQIPFDRHRVIGVALSVLVWGGLSILFGSMVSSQWLFTLFGAIYALLVRSITFLVTPLLWLFIGQETRLLEWWDQEQAAPTLAPLPTPLPLENIPQNGEIDLVQSPLFASPPVLWGVIFLAVLAVLLFIRTRDRGKPLFRRIQVQQSHPTQANLRSSLPDGYPLATRLGRSERVRAAARIRQVYANLLDLCTQLGHPRPESKTPLEYLNTLYILFPTLPSEVEGITAAYLRVRYGELPETRREVRSVDTAWRRISREGKALLAANRRSVVKKPD